MAQQDREGGVWCDSGGLVLREGDPALHGCHKIQTLSGNTMVLGVQSHARFCPHLLKTGPKTYQLPLSENPTDRRSRRGTCLHHMHFCSIPTTISMQELSNIFTINQEQEGQTGSLIT